MTAPASHADGDSISRARPLVLQERLPHHILGVGRRSDPRTVCELLPGRGVLSPQAAQPPVELAIISHRSARRQADGRLPSADCST